MIHSQLATSDTIFLMKFWKNNPSSSSFISLAYLWWLPALFPLLLVFYSLTAETWSWGLMDDHNMAYVVGGVWENAWQLAEGLFKAGRLNPTYALHSAILYKIFQNHPGAYFVFRFFEVLLALIFWSLSTVSITKSKYAAPIFLTVTLSFFKFYDSFYFLSTNEILGILFSGICVYLLLKRLTIVFNSNEKFSWNVLVGAGLCFLLAITSKEPFIAVGMALGLSLMVMGWKEKKKNILAIGMGIFIFSIGYMAVLKFFIIKGYSAQYTLTKEMIFANLSVWRNKVVFNHLPWIFAGIILMFTSRSVLKLSPIMQWGAICGISLYLFYLICILPWSAWGHYVIPLGVFFAFTFTILMTDIVTSLRPSLMALIIALGLIFNVFIGGKAVYFHVNYQYDTQNMLDWLAHNAIFKHEVADGSATVRCNAEEPSSAIPKLTNAYFGTAYANFIYTAKVKDILLDSSTKYFVWAPSWGDQDLRKLQNMWTPMFISKSWIVFRRMY